jgi:Carboxypeptidase regulatory-like domain/TonB-dependent Receptor Plug Domain
MIVRVCALATALLLAAHGVQADTPGIGGRITDPAGFPLPGVVVTLLGDAAPSFSAVTDQEGDYSIDAPAGRYRLTVELAGFQAAERADVVVQSGLTIIDVSLALAPFQDSVTVSADATPPSLIGEPQPNAPSTVSRTVIDRAMLPNSRYEDVLTLMPTVVRGPDDRISIGGAPASTGSLVVNGFNETDPVSGQPGVVVPIEAVDSVEVHAGGYPADLGRATGGVTSIQTRSGSNQFHLSIDSIFPRLLFGSGTVRGVEYWEPNVGVSGPLVKGRLFFEQALSYRFDRNRFTTLAGPEHNVYNQPLYWSQLDANLSQTQHVRLALAVDEQHTDHANITAFTPDTSVPRLAEDGWSVALSDRFTTARNATLELKASLLTTDASVEPAGAAPYVLGHGLAAGSYFDRQSRRGQRLEGGAAWTFMPSNGQVVKAGATVGRSSLLEADAAAPVRLLRADGSASRVVSFLPADPFRVATNEGAVFAQDTWTARPWLVVDAGVRYDRVAAVGDGAVSPRVAWTIKRKDDGLSVSGSAGNFADKLVLGALAFPGFPSRVVALFDSGGPSMPSVRVDNVIDGSLRVPQAGRWDVSLDRTFTSGWLAHLRYQERHGRDELIVQPATASSGASLLALSSSGRSTARSLEATFGYRRPAAADELYVSYVRESTRGDLNAFGAVDGLFKDPFVQANQVGPLPADVPNRLLAWGLIRLPGQMTLAPFLDVRDGFPYSAVDDDWVYVGARDGLRMPWFGSLDLSLTRVVDLPGRLPHARVGLKLYNIAQVHSEREIQRDVASPDFGARYDPTPRDFSLVCVFLVGRR